jgi:hypothetical protein
MGVAFPPVSAAWPNTPLAAHWASLWLLASAPLAADAAPLGDHRFNATADGVTCRV